MIIDNSFDIQNRRRFAFTQSIKTYYRAPKPQPQIQVRPTAPIQIEQRLQPPPAHEQTYPSYQQPATSYQHQAPVYQQPVATYPQPAQVIQPIVSVQAATLPPPTQLPVTEAPEVEEEEAVEEEPPVETTLPPEVVQPEPETDLVDHKLPSDKPEEQELEQKLPPIANETDNLVIGKVMSHILNAASLILNTFLDVISYSLHLR